jgi:hypothetical protein
MLGSLVIPNRYACPRVLPIVKVLGTFPRASTKPSVKSTLAVAAKTLREAEAAWWQLAPEATTMRGLFGGKLVGLTNGDGFSLTKYVLSPGVFITGKIEFADIGPPSTYKGTIKVTGPGAVAGPHTISQNSGSGRLGGRSVKGCYKQLLPAMHVGFWPAITRRQSPPSFLPRLPALAANECGLWLGARDPETRQHHWQGHSLVAVFLFQPARWPVVVRRVAAARAVERRDVLERDEDMAVELDVSDVLDVAVGRQHAFLVLTAEERDLHLLTLVLVGVVLHGAVSLAAPVFPP